MAPPTHSAGTRSLPTPTRPAPPLIEPRTGPQAPAAMALLPRQAAAEAARAPGALLRTCPPPAAPFLAPPRPAPRQPGLRRPVPAAEAAVRLHPLPCSANADAVSTDASGLDATFEPEDARGAISMGLKLHDGGRYEEALQMFQRAVELPGTGLKRYRQGQKEAHTCLISPPPGGPQCSGC